MADAPRAASGSSSDGPRRLGVAVSKAVEEAAPQTTLAEAQTQWASASGSRVASRSQPVAERDGVLTVACASATWAHELDLMQLQLLDALNERLDSGPLSALRFVVGDSGLDPG